MKVSHWSVLVLVLVLGLKQPLVCKHEYSLPATAGLRLAFYAAACGPTVGGTPNRLAVFQILRETYFYVNSYIIPFSEAI
jgi:hypothetical protein